MRNLLSVILFAVLLLAACADTFGQEKKNIASYKVNVRVDPDSGTLVCKTEIQDPADSCFILNKDLTLIRVEADGEPIKYRLNASQFPPNSIEIAVGPESHQSLVFEYAGRLNPDAVPKMVSAVNMISPDLVEMAMYVAWYPRPKNGSPFDFRLVADLPSRFTTVANGALRNDKVKNDRSITKWESFGPASDIALIAAPDLHRTCVTSGDVTVEIYHTKLPDAYIDSMTTNLFRSTAWLTSKLGAPRSNELVRVVYSPRPAWGYVRTPLIIVSEEASLTWRSQPFGPARDFRYLTHEIAHYWWASADMNTPEDWINEGLAEYSAFIASQDIVGKEFADHLLVEYKDRVGSIHTPIALTENNSPDREVNRYTRPVLIFEEARMKYGTEKLNGFFAALYKRFTDTRVTTTAAFLDEADKQLGPGAKDFFTGKLYKN
jgi:hypothetical protein